MTVTVKEFEALAEFLKKNRNLFTPSAYKSFVFMLGNLLGGPYFDQVKYLKDCGFK